MPKLQTSGGLCYFLHHYLGHPIPSPALLQPRHDAFVKAVEQYAARHHVPLISFDPRDRKDDVVAPSRTAFTAREGVVVIGVAQEKARSFKATKRRTPTGSVAFDFSRQWVFVKHYDFYVQDRDWGPGFLKICTYLPYPVKLCLNGHEWVKQHLRRRRLAFTSLDNGFLTCADPVSLQQVCDRLGAADVQGFFDRWSTRLPGTHRYTATTYGLKVAFFYSKLYLRILRPSWQALLPAQDALPRPLRDALDHLDREIATLHQEAAVAA